MDRFWRCLESMTACDGPWFGNCPGWVRTAVGGRGKLPSLRGRTDGSASEDVRAQPGWAQREEGAVVFGGMLVPFVVLTALDQQQYFLPAAFATLFAAMCDPGGEYRTRVQMMAGMAVAGALLTGLGFAVGARGWGLVVLAAFVVPLAAGLMVKFGGDRIFGVR